MPNVKSRPTKRFEIDVPPQAPEPWGGFAERADRFGENMIRFAKRLPMNAITEPIIGQLVQAATDIGAEYSVATATISKKRNAKCLRACIESACRAKHWLRMIATALPLIKREARMYWKEAEALNLLFAAALRQKK